MIAIKDTWTTSETCLRHGLWLLLTTGLICAGCSPNEQAKLDRQTDETVSPTDSTPDHEGQDSVTETTDSPADSTVPAGGEESDAAGIEALPSAAEEQPNSAANEPNEPQDNAIENVVPDAKINGSTDAPSEPVEPTQRRILLMPLTGPVVVEWELTCGPKSLHDEWLASATVLIGAADSNGDGQTNWSELLDHPMLLQLAFGQMPFEDDRARETVALSYDANSNQVVEAGELIRVLGRSLRSQDGLLIQTESFDPFQRVANSGVNQWLDASGDGVLSTEDKRNAPQRLRLRDADEDGRLWPGDFASTPVPLNRDMGMTYRPPRGPVPVRAVTEQTEWGQLLTDLEEIYAFGSPLTPMDFASSKSLYEALDADGDEELRVSEVARLASVPADLVIHFDRQTSQLSLASRSSNRQHVETSTDDSSPSVRRLVIDDAATELTVVVLPEEASGSAPDPVELLTSGDRDKNQYLDESEFRNIGLFQYGSFENLDRNDDDRVDLPELDLVTKVVQAFSRSGLRLYVRPDEDPVFAALDVNRNGRLDSREIGQSDAILTELDANQDGHLSSSELPSRLEILLSGRAPYQPGQPNPTGTALSYNDPQRTGAPNWFTQMDLNQDGEIGEAEFLGTAETFSELDQDHDGFVELSEIKVSGEAR